MTAYLICLSYYYHILSAISLSYLICYLHILSLAYLWKF